MSQTYYFIGFDGELLFHNGRTFYSLAKLEGFASKYDAIRGLLKEKNLLKKALFSDWHDDELGGQPACIKMPSGTSIYDEDKFEQDLKYYSENPQKFIDSLDSTWKERDIDAYAFVNADETTLKILLNGEVIDTEKEAIITPQLEQ